MPTELNFLSFYPALNDPWGFTTVLRDIEKLTPSFNSYPNISTELEKILNTRSDSS